MKSSTRLGVLGYFGFAAVLGCSGGAGPGEVTGTSASQEPLSLKEPPAPTYFMARPARVDPRACEAEPKCRGWFVRAVNRDTEERHIESIDLVSSGLDPSSVMSEMIAADGQLVLRGSIDGEVLNATDVYLGMPETVADPAQAFYSVRELVYAPRRIAVVSELNSRVSFRLGALDVTEAARPFVDLDWLAWRVIGNGALVASARTGSELHASQIFIHLPDRAASCPQTAVPCPSGAVAKFERNVDRCLVQVGCASVRRTVCPLLTETCDPGYREDRWRGLSGCPQMACDPAFVDPREAPTGEPLLQSDTADL